MVYHVDNTANVYLFIKQINSQWTTNTKTHGVCHQLNIQNRSDENINWSTKNSIEIAADIGIKQNHISKVLNQLKEMGLVQLINLEAKKGRIYELTDVGFEIAKELK